MPNYKYIYNGEVLAHYETKNIDNARGVVKFIIRDCPQVKGVSPEDILISEVIE